MRRSTSQVSLPDICEVVTDGTHDSPKLLPHGVPFIKGKHISSGRIDFAACDYIGEEDHAKCIRRIKPQVNDVLFSNIGSVGDAARVFDDIDFSIKNVALFRPDPQKVDPLYFYYLVISPYFRGHFLNVRSGAAQPFISLESFRSLKFRCISDQDAQQKIGRVLSAYDDLIENNRRRIQLLEQAARLLYKEWFVHLRFPGHEHIKITDGVPEGWERLELGKLCSLRAGGVFKPKYQGNSTGDYPFIKVRDMNGQGNGIVITEADNWVTVDACDEFRGRPFARGTSVFAKIGEALRQNRVRFLVRETLIDNNLMGAIPKREVVEDLLLYYLLATYDIASHASGAAVPFLSANVLSQIRFLVPPASIQRHFNGVVAPAFEQITTLQRQSTEAAKARDLLLPRLMNGEIPV